MTASSFKQSLSLVLEHEGGYVNHPLDPGGPTNHGVTQRVYDDYRKVHGQATQSVKLISSTEVSDIYCKQYWKLVRADSLTTGLDYAVFDFAVNSGLSRAIRYLQRTLKLPMDDGIVGNSTLAAVYAADNLKLIADYCNNRMAFLKSLSTFPTFGAGWTRRVCGSVLGAQENDTGVVDYAYIMAQNASRDILANQVLLKPSSPAPGKAFSNDYNSWPMAEKNDYLSKLIEAS